MDEDQKRTGHMDNVLIVIALLTLVFSLITLVELWVGFRLIQNLSQQILLEPAKLPSVSIILSALNEAADIETCVISLLKMNYPDFEVIAINDRSEDNTPDILNTLSQQYPHLRVHHISSLPENWFGKNHALYVGSKLAKGEWLLFTDADVRMKPETLSRAMSYVLTKGLHHLTINEHHFRNTFWLTILLLGNYLTYSLALKPWRMRFAWSRKSVGHGAFNLVNKETWFACGTHQAIPLECLDDLKLGELVKKKGYHQDIVDGRDFVQRAWYLDLPDMIQGWKKNTFAWFEYRFPLVCLSTIGVFLYFIWPILAIMCCTGATRWLNGLNVLLMLGMTTLVCQQYRLSLRYAFLYPASIALLMYAIWNSAISIFNQKGIMWRNTFYSLQKLKEYKKS